MQYFMVYLNKIKKNTKLWIISLFITIAEITKSAQIPMFSWIPVAIAIAFSSIKLI